MALEKALKHSKCRGGNGSDPPAPPERRARRCCSGGRKGRARRRLDRRRDRGAEQDAAAHGEADGVPRQPLREGLHPQGEQVPAAARRLAQGARPRRQDDPLLGVSMRRRARAALGVALLDEMIQSSSRACVAVTLRRRSSTSGLRRPRSFAPRSASSPPSPASSSRATTRSTSRTTSRCVCAVRGCERSRVHRYAPSLPCSQAGKDEVRAWTIKVDSPAPKAAGVIHTVGIQTSSIQPSYHMRPRALIVSGAGLREGLHHGRGHELRWCGLGGLYAGQGALVMLCVLVPHALQTSRLTAAQRPL